MDLYRAAERAMAMRDSDWLRHASAASVWSRALTPLPLLALAIWSRLWLGWAALVPVALVALWIWLNPRLFAAPATFETWAARGVLGERVFLRHRARVAPHHRRAAHGLTALSLAGLVPYALGLWTFEPWAVVAGTLMIALPKLWFLDRMVWVWADFRRDGGTLADLAQTGPQPGA